MASLRIDFVSTICLVIFISWAPAPSMQNHYCSISKDHTLCKFQGVGPRCKTPFEIGIPTSDRNIIMSLHNSLRNMVATGNERRGRPGPQPSAANMRQMEWDDELAATAQRLADQCKYNHDCLMCRKVDRFLTGQNLYQFSENLIRDGANWEQAIMAWYDETKDFNPRNVDYFEFRKELGHYTQMLWADTYRVGCGYAYYNDGKWYRKLYICNYGPAGNIITTPMYKKGSPCSDCPEGTSCSNQYPGLCSGSGSSYYQPAAAPKPLGTTRLPPSTTRRTTTPRPTTTRRPTTTTTRRTTTTAPPRIIFNEIESNEILPVGNIQTLSIANRFGGSQNSQNRIVSNNNRQNQNNRQNYYTNSPVTTRVSYYEPTTRRSYYEQTTRKTYYQQPTTPRTVYTTRPPLRTTTRRLVSYSPQIVSINDRTPVRPQSTAITTYNKNKQTSVSSLNNNRLPPPPQTPSNSHIPFSQSQNKIDNHIQSFTSGASNPAVLTSPSDILVRKIDHSPAHLVPSTDTILLYCDFDFEKCPIRFTGESWNYTVIETPGYGRGFGTVVERNRLTNLYIRSIMTPQKDGNICLHFRFINYHFSPDGSPARGSGLGPDGKPLTIQVTAGTLRQKPMAVELTQISKTPTDWLSARVQFRNLQSMFLLIFQVPNNVLQDNVYFAIDDVLVTEGICHT